MCTACGPPEFWGRPAVLICQAIPRLAGNPRFAVPGAASQQFSSRATCPCPKNGQPDQQPTLMASRGSLSASIMASAYSSLGAAPKPAKVRSPLMSRVTSTSRVGALTLCTPSRSTPLPAARGRALSDLGEASLPAWPATPLPAPHHRVSSGSGTCSKQTVTAEQGCVRSRDRFLHARWPSRQTCSAEASQHQASGHRRSCITHSGSHEQLNRSAVSLRRARGSARLHSDWQQGSVVKHFRSPGTKSALGEQLISTRTESIPAPTGSSGAAPSGSPLSSSSRQDLPPQVRNLHAGSMALTINHHVSTEAQQGAPRWHQNSDNSLSRSSIICLPRSSSPMAVRKLTLTLRRPRAATTLAGAPPG